MKRAMQHARRLSLLSLTPSMITTQSYELERFQCGRVVLPVVLENSCEVTSFVAEGRMSIQSNDVGLPGPCMLMPDGFRHLP